MKIAEKIDALIGHTPLLALNNYSAKRGLDKAIVVKLLPLLGFAAISVISALTINLS